MPAKRKAAASAEPAGKEEKKMWGGRFTGKVDPVMEAFNSSIGEDKVLWKVDLEGSRGYSHALERAGVLTNKEGNEIRAALKKVGEEWASGAFKIEPADEDIHMANERRLTEICGAAGAKIHTARSRNDQVATDVRLWLRDEGHAQVKLLADLLNVAAERAGAEVDALMPGYTHLQRAQPIRWSHWIMCHAASWRRDAERLAQGLERANQMPLGSGALAGNPFAINREALAKDLGFDAPMSNSLDGVTDRDFILEFSSWATMLMVHLSKFAEDLIIFGTAEFGFVHFADAYSTGSSLMPQKKNPDALELLRGKTARVIGNHSTLLTMMKGLPTAYNKDMQEDKRALFDTAATTRAALQIAAGVLSTLTISRERMQAALSAPLLATDLSDYLVRKGMPFREAHHVVGSAVKLAETKKCELNELTDADYKTLSALFAKDVGEVWDFEKAVERRDETGGTSKRAVLEQVTRMQTFVAKELSKKK
jgi:argininosuccinate lyase